MENILIEVRENEIFGKDKLDFDLYNANGDLLHKKQEKLEAGLLLQLKYTKAFKVNAITDEVDEFIRELLLMGVRKKTSKIVIETVKNNVDISFYKDKEKQDSTGLDLAYFNDIVKKLKDYANHEKNSEFYISLMNRQIRIKSVCEVNRVTLEISDLKKSEQQEFLKQPDFSGSIIKRIRSFIEKEDSVLFLAGPPGSARKNTCNAILGLSNSSIEILTIDTPDVFETIKDLDRENLRKHNAILAQKQVKRLCDNCKEKYQPSPEQINSIFKHDNRTEVCFYRPKGCLSCKNTGFSGLIPIHEFFEFNISFIESLGLGASDSRILKRIKALGFESFEYDNIKKVLLGLTLPC